MSGPQLPQRFLDVAIGHSARAMPPVHLWNPAYCGEIDMRIARDGRWFYAGSPILRLPLVKLFASILRHDGDRHVLVTPVERVGIIVEDAPFLAVDMDSVDTPDGASLAFRTNLDDLVIVGAEHPLRFSLDGSGGLKPYVRIRGDLWARLTRALAYDLAGMVGIDAEGGYLDLGGLRFRLPASEDSAA